MTCKWLITIMVRFRPLSTVSSPSKCPIFMASKRELLTECFQNRGKTPKMDGENNGTPYKSGWFGSTTILGNIQLLTKWEPILQALPEVHFSVGSPRFPTKKVRTLPPMMKRAGMMMHQLSERMGFFGFGSRWYEILSFGRRMVDEIKPLAKTIVIPWNDGGLMVMKVTIQGIVYPRNCWWN